jgi:predicted 3-demethylubiquinone-9 3-methyltransferase (glyoxalase superfamily)
LNTFRKALQILNDRNRDVEFLALGSNDAPLKDKYGISWQIVPTFVGEKSKAKGTKETFQIPAEAGPGPLVLSQM